jgi:hypothetical protein
MRVFRLDDGLPIIGVLVPFVQESIDIVLRVVWILGLKVRTVVLRNPDHVLFS